MLLAEILIRLFDKECFFSGGGSHGFQGGKDGGSTVHVFGYMQGRLLTIHSTPGRSRAGPSTCLTWRQEMIRKRRSVTHPKNNDAHHV